MKPFLERLEKPILQSIEEAGIKSADLHSVEILGGTTRIPIIRQEISNILNKGLSTTLNCEETIATGTALYSAIQSNNFKTKIQTLKFKQNEH